MTSTTNLITIDIIKFEYLNFEIYNLFRISCFEFRILLEFIRMFEQFLDKVQKLGRFGAIDHLMIDR